jgi:Cu(I)/Ag(I) efflux system membrane protein CusA/SilA
MIALAGVAVEIYVLIVMYIGYAVEAGRAKGAMNSLAEFEEAVIAGCSKRLRPIIMTWVAVVGGLLPIMWGAGTGSEVMKRIATPMVGGMLSAVLASFFVVPVVYVLIKQKEFER